MAPVTQSEALIVASAGIALVGLAVIHHRGRDGMRLRFIMLINYVVAYQLSAYAHVFRKSTSRGYYEALAGAPVGSTTGLVPASWAMLFGTVAMIAGLWPIRKLPHEGRRAQGLAEFSWARQHRALALTTGLAMSAISGLALLKVLSAVSGSGDQRIIAVGGGNARYVFLAGWLPWGIVLVTLALRSTRKTPLADLWNALLLIGGCAAIGGSEAWNGGRSSVLFDTFPLLVLFLPKMGLSKWLTAVLGTVSMSVFVWTQTVARSGGQPFDAWGLADWQWGRFSMSAWAFKYVSVHGIVHGETYLSGLIVVPASLAHFAGTSIVSPFQPVVALTGEYLRGSADQNYIVPGSMAELTVNFGMLGVIFGYYIFGRVSGMLADWYRSAEGELEKLLVAGISTSVMALMVMQFEAFFQGVIMSMFPVYALVIVERVAMKRHRLKEERLAPDTHSRVAGFNPSGRLHS